nr:hypothetical protein [Tanacetum cinerariifolium]
AKMKVNKKETEIIWMFEIKDDLFNCDIPLGMTFNEFNRLSGMNDDLFTYKIRGDDEEVVNDKKLFDLKETHVNEDDEVAEIFRIKNNIFNFEMPLCKIFNEFNYLFKIDTDLITHDIPGFKTYDE